MPSDRIYLCLAQMSKDGLEQKYIQEAFDTNWVVPLGPNVNGFEADLEKFVGFPKKVVALSSCTAAIHLALLALGVGQGDEVLCPSFSFCASSNPVTYCGAKPVFVDSELDTWNMDPALLEQAIQDRMDKTGKKPKAIIVVDLYGMPAHWEKLERIGKQYDIPIIEDAANALGSLYKGKPCGSFGQLGTFSFNGNKMITTSGGGALVCNDDETKKRIVFLSTQAREPFPYYQHETIGYNYRMSNICAGIGRGQMSVLKDHIAHHKHLHQRYRELLEDVKGVVLFDNPNADFDSCFWLSTITMDPKLSVKGQKALNTSCEPNPNVEALRIYLDQKGIEARPLWKPMHKQPVYQGVERGELSVESLSNGIVRQTSDRSVSYISGISEQLFRTGMCLPSGPCVSDEDVHYIVDCIKAAIG